MHFQRFMSLWDMITSITGNTFAATANLGQMINSLYEAAANAHDDIIQMKASIIDTLGESLEDMARVAADLELDATVASADQCVDLMKRIQKSSPGVYVAAKADIERLAWMLQAFRMNFSTQMSSRLVLVLGSKHSHYLTSDEPPFGKDVEDVFPTASEEISEAAKCLALNRPTAVVFHLMRAMELAVQKLAESIGVTKVEKVWGNLLSDIESAIKQMPKGKVKDAWSASHAHLYHVKQAWRNDTMHPKTTYTEAQAQTVFYAVKSFMEHLAPLVVSKAQP